MTWPIADYSYKALLLWKSIPFIEWKSFSSLRHKVNRFPSSHPVFFHPLWHPFNFRHAATIFALSFKKPPPEYTALAPSGCSRTGQSTAVCCYPTMILRVYNPGITLCERCWWCCTQPSLHCPPPRWTDRCSVLSRLWVEFFFSSVLPVGCTSVRTTIYLLLRVSEYCLQISSEITRLPKIVCFFCPTSMP